MGVILIVGSPSQNSRSGKIIEYAQSLLNNNHISNQAYSVRDFSAEDIFYANYNSETLKQFISDVDQSEGIVIATPIYKSSLAGVLKSLLDLLPEEAFKDKVILPFANAGSIAHLLALDYSLKPILSSMKASEIISGVIAKDTEIQQTGSDVFSPDLKKRIDESLQQFLQALHRLKQANSFDFII